MNNYLRFKHIFKILKMDGKPSFISKGIRRLKQANLAPRKLFRYAQF